ncbi:uncharacterized protein [Triticum aestivum]|uniref:uncharacterized protein n=2 Tax=Triticum TaxID=4564 RepID=UPI0008447D98|nr:uncharacterized protein LOC123153348 [Triticum aestivum]
MAASLLSRAASAAFALRGGARLLPKETPLPPPLLLPLLLILLATAAGTLPAVVTLPLQPPPRSARSDSVRLLETCRAGSDGRAAEVGCGASLSPSMTRFGIAVRFNAMSSAVSEAATTTAASSVVHAVPRTEPVMSAEWLHANLRDPDVKVLDASWSEDGEFLIPIEFILCRFLRHDLDCRSHVQVQ